MPLVSKPSSVAHISLVYITVGALITVWTAIRYFYLTNNPPPPDSTAYYWCAGFLVSGLAFLTIGLGLGRIGRAARQAELPPAEATPAVAQADQAAAARAPLMAPMNPAAPVAPQVPVAVPNTVAPTQTGAAQLRR